MWNDSPTVLQWLTFTTKHPLFVANRVGEIIEHTTVDEYNHVDSSDNPADAGTRDISAEVLQSRSEGPGIPKNQAIPVQTKH